MTPELDRDGTITLPMGVRLDHFRKNPVFLWMHPLPSADENGALPPPPPPDVLIGRVADYAQSEEALDILVDFVPGEINEQAEQCYQLVEGGFLRAVSWCGPILKKEDRDVGGRTVTVNVEVDLWEASLCIVGSNPGALVLDRALRALAAQRPIAEPAQATAPARTSTPEPKPTKRSARVDKNTMMAKLGLPEECSDRKTAMKALDRYMDTTGDDAEGRAMMRSAMEAHFPEGGHAEPDGDEPAPAAKEMPDGEVKAAEGDEDEVDKMDEKAVRAALKMARRAAAVAPGGADAKIAREVDDLIADGQVENTPKRRAEAVALHAQGHLVPALRAAGIKPGTFTTSQRLRGGRLGTETELATRGADPSRAQPVEARASEQAKSDAKSTIDAMDRALTGNRARN